jgi:hypothetical protein
MSEQEGKQIGAEIPDNAQDLTIFVQNLLEQMVSTFFFVFLKKNLFENFVC